MQNSTFQSRRSSKQVSLTLKRNFSQRKTRKMLINPSKNSLLVQRSLLRNQFPTKTILPQLSQTQKNLKPHSTDCSPAIGTCLSFYEQQEILTCDRVYYQGQNRVLLDPQSGMQFWERQDASGHTTYKFNKGDHIAYRFELIQVLGEGAFGSIFEVFDHKTQEKFAMKVKKKVSTKEATNEAQVLQMLNKHCPRAPVLRLYDSFMFRGFECLLTERLQENLQTYLNLHKAFDLDAVRVIARQLLEALAGVHKLNFVHCDLKPSNIVIAQEVPLAIKLLDFGTACCKGKSPYSYFQTRFYRSPEVILGLPYTEKIDIWGLGCTLAELYTGVPLFPGVTESEMLHLFSKCVGRPPKQLSRAVSNHKLIILGLSCIGSRHPSLHSIIPDESFLIFLTGTSYVDCLKWRAEDRPSASSLLAYSFFLS